MHSRDVIIMPSRFYASRAILLKVTSTIVSRRAIKYRARISALDRSILQPRAVKKGKGVSSSGPLSRSESLRCPQSDSICPWRSSFGEFFSSRSPSSLPFSPRKYPLGFFSFHSAVSVRGVVKIPRHSKDLFVQQGLPARNPLFSWPELNHYVYWRRFQGTVRKKFNLSLTAVSH